MRQCQHAPPTVGHTLFSQETGSERIRGGADREGVGATSGCPTSVYGLVIWGVTGWVARRFALGLRFGTCVIGLCAGTIMVGGCSSHSGHAGAQGVTSQSSASRLELAAGSYESAFDAAVSTLRRAGYDTQVRDRAAGRIRTDTQLCGSLLEPWRTDNDGFSASLEQTITLQRRRVQLVFVPADFNPAAAESPRQAPRALTGTPLPGSTRDAPRDMRKVVGPIAIEIQVDLERAFTPGRRSGSWTRSQGSWTKDPLANNTGQGQLASSKQLDFSDQQGPAAQRWTPLRRDSAAEKRIRELLGAAFASNGLLATNQAN